MNQTTHVDSKTWDEKPDDKSAPRSSSGWEDDEQRDERGPAVVVRGGFNGGFKFYGPFESIASATEWVKTQTILGLVGAHGDSIVLLEEPPTDGLLV